MVFESDIIFIIEQWRQRALKNKDDACYNNALLDCAQELETILYDSWRREAEIKESEYLNNLPPEEVQKYFEEQEADSYLSSLDNHFRVA
jgi:hypothetical protein